MNHVELAALLTRQTVYLMGISFMLGSLFTIFILLILDMMRVAREHAEVMDVAEQDESDRDAA